MNVAENLYDYLKNNDKAELIGFGTFYIKSHSATINTLTNTMTPPKKEVLFTIEQTNDMNFVKFMAKHEFISEETALTWIKQYSSSLKEKIDSGRTYTIGKLGKLTKGTLGEYVFASEENLNLMDDSFALGELKNIKTFDIDQNQKVDFVHTKPEKEIAVENKVEVEKVEEGKQMAIEEERQKDIKQRIEEIQKLKEEEKIQESEPETTTRIIRHTEATIQTDVEKPVAEKEVTQKVNIDSTPSEDKTEKTIKEAEKQKDNIIVEDIERNELSEQEELRKKAQEIIDRNKKEKENPSIVPPQMKRTRRHNNRKRGWLIVFWIIVLLILLCGGFICAHYFGLLKNVKFLEPITNKLSYYIPVKKEAKTTKVIKPQTITPTETPQEQAVAPEVEQTPYIGQQSNIPTPEPRAKIAKKTAKNNKNTKNKTQKQTKPNQQPVVRVDNNAPVLTQNYSKLGFDVVGGSFGTKSQAENLARKAKSLGYDSYVLSKIKSGSPIYYVSYGSRRTLREANDLMQSMMNKMGGNYYVISR